MAGTVTICLPRKRRVPLLLTIIMTYMQKFLCRVLLPTLMPFLLASCTGTERQETKNRLSIVCTTGILADAVMAIAGDYAQVTSLMGPGVDPHLYRARESDMRTLANADIIFYHGLHLEGKMGDLFMRMKKRVCTVAVGQAVPQDKLRQSEFEGMYDPHIWHDVRLWKYAVNCVGQTLQTQDPSHKLVYESRLKEYIKKLDLLDKQVKAATQTLPKEQRVLVTAHDAFGYFGAAYGFDVIGLQGMSTDAEVGTRDIRDLVSFIVARKVPAIFVESSIPRKNLEAVRQAVLSRRWQVEIGPELFSDALGDKASNASTYSDMIRYNTESIVSALGKKEHG